MAVVDASCNRTAINVCQVLPLLVVNTTISNLLPSNCFLFSLLTAFWRKPNSPKPNWNALTQDEKEIVSALGQLAAGVASDSVESGIQGAVAGNNAVYNHALSTGHDEEEWETEHGKSPIKILKINPLKVGIVADEGNVGPAGGKLLWPGNVKACLRQERQER
ncbi:VENN motif pre-toxin domain-containing protein [Duffyella gerundensis]|uniref:VENN motif pre-toxin domain-containing protein n=1 Tax=Duffyella gerundensis TaxID=1619313 RepID=UPI00223AEA24|nr:VENN motif pre-toxin domain-containing protein [Duffyella gerundensis]